MERVDFSKNEDASNDEVLKAKRELLKNAKPFKPPKLFEALDFKLSEPKKPLELGAFAPPVFKLELAPDEDNEEEQAASKPETAASEVKPPAAASEAAELSPAAKSEAEPEPASPEADTAQAEQVEYDKKFEDLMSREAESMDPDFVAGASGEDLGFTLPEIDASLDFIPAPGSNVVRNAQFLSFSRPVIERPEASRLETPASTYAGPGPGGAPAGAEFSPSAMPNIGRLAEAAVNLAELAQLVNVDPKLAVARLATSLMVEGLFKQSWFRSSANEQMAHLQKEQAELRQRLGQETSRRNLVANQSVRFEQMPDRTGPEQQKFMSVDGREIVFQPGWHLERSGAYYAVLDQHNRLVQYAIPRGAEFWREQSQEAAGAYRAAEDQSGSGAAGQAPAMGAGSVLVPGMVVLPQAAQPAQAGQAKPSIDNRNTFVAAATSPWLWAAVAALVIAFFVAALA